MAVNPQYANIPKSYSVIISTANTSRDGTTGAYGTLYPAGGNGGRVDKVRVQALGTTTAGMIRFFVGTALIYELPVTAITASATLPVFGADVTFDNGMTLAASAVLKVSTNNAESFAITIINGGDF